MRRPSSKTLAVLRELAAWREETAMDRNLPRPWVARDEALAEIAQNLPRDSKQLAHIRGLKDHVAHGEDGKALLAAIKRGLSVPEQERPEPPPRRNPAQAEESTVALLAALLRLRCDEHEVTPRLVASKDDLERLAEDPGAELPALSGWRREIFGADALALLRGEIALTVEGGQVVARGTAPG